MNKSLRIIDANFNRAREGLRVIEDGLRFNNVSCTGCIIGLKALRHGLCEAVEKHFGLTNLKRERDIQRDGGKEFDTRQKTGIDKIIIKNFLRVEEALRTIEEYSKTVTPQASREFHDMRFNVYKFEKDITALLNKKKLKIPSLYVIVNVLQEEISKDALGRILDLKPDLVRFVFRGSISCDERLLSKAQILRELVPEDIIYIVDSRADICLFCEADGVHLSGGDIPAGIVRGLLADKLIGLTLSGGGDIEKLSARKNDFDYLLVEDGSPLASPGIGGLQKNIFKGYNAGQEKPVFFSFDIKNQDGIMNNKSECIAVNLLPGQTGLLCATMRCLKSKVSK